MKKILIIGLIVALVMIIVGGAGVAYAQFRGINRNAFVTVNSIQNADGAIRQFSYGPGNMMGGYANGDCPGGKVGGYGPGGMMGGYANGNCPGGQVGGYGPGGMMGERGFRNGPGMMGGRGFAQGEGIMHDYMISSFADAVGLTAKEVETRLSNGDTLKDITITQGTAEADLPALTTQVRQAALDKAVDDGVITQAQADLMQEHMSNYQGPGFGPGYGMEDCPMWDGDEQQLP
jgi:hypothetical protein